VPTVRFNLVDVFTDRAFAGNQLGVFTDARGLTDKQMLALARELDFSESTFVLPPEAGGHARVRIFTTACEVPFAGHPVLGTAFVLAAPMQLVRIDLETGSGIVPVVLEREGARIVFGRMQQPVPTWRSFERAAELLEALGLAPDAAQLPIIEYDNGLRHTFVALASAEQVAALRPDFARLAEVVHDGVSCFSARGASVKTRMFAPGLGAPEDAATGSAAGPLAVHLARHGAIAWGEEIEISQGVEIGRPSSLYARAEGGPDAVTSVEVGGSAVVVGRGELAV
jgi:trans-2,3-dihydro-3-hydroxyanthranilate isomerase